MKNWEITKSGKLRNRTKTLKEKEDELFDSELDTATDNHAHQKKDIKGATSQTGEGRGSDSSVKWPLIDYDHMLGSVAPSSTDDVDNAFMPAVL